MRRVVRVLDRMEEYLCAVILLFMALLGFANVAVRYLTTFSLAFSEELLVNLFVWLSLLGIAIGVKRQAHLGVTVLTDLFPRSWQRVVLALAAVAGIVLFVIVLRQGWELTLIQRSWGARSYSLDLPMWWFSAGIPVGAAFVLIRLLQALWWSARHGLDETREAAASAGEGTHGA